MHGVGKGPIYFGWRREGHFGDDNLYIMYFLPKEELIYNIHGLESIVGLNLSPCFNRKSIDERFSQS